MDDYNKIIEAIGVKFIKSRRIEVLRTVGVGDFYDVDNIMMLVNRGGISFGENKTALTQGDILFIPSGRTTSITFGSDEEAKVTGNAGLDKFFHQTSTISGKDNFSLVSFETKVFNSVNFFQSLDIPAFKIDQWGKAANLINEIIEENNSSLIGKERVITLNTERLAVELIRYVLDKGHFKEQVNTNATYFKDPRLLDIFAYIKENLNEDLSNKTLSNVANVSEDYVGQYFKMLTGINPQDYIEYQRMERAVYLLRTTKKSVREIGKEVGYKDTAYFCRRFKLMFKVPAGKMRKKDTLINV